MKKEPRFRPIDNPLAREFLLEGDRRGVLLIHGFTATPSQMRPLGEALHREGYTVLAVLLPLVLLARRRAWVVDRAVPATSVAIALVGVVLVVTRVF